MNSIILKTRPSKIICVKRPDGLNFEPNRNRYIFSLRENQVFDETSKILYALELDDAKSSWLLMFLFVVTSKLELATQNWLIRSWYSFCFSLQFTINVFWSDWGWFYTRLITVMSVSLMFLFKAKINLIKTELLVNILKQKYCAS